jgi:type IV secretory pathway VirB4 component
VTVGWSGSGKSYFAKLEAIRSRYRGMHVAIIDPEGEYRSLASVGASVHTVGTKEAGLNFQPFMLKKGTDDDYDSQVEFILRLLPRLTDGWADRHLRSFMQAVYPGAGEMDQSDDWMQRLAAIDREAGDVVRTAVARWQQMAGPSDSTSERFNLPEFAVYDVSRISDRLKGAMYLALSEMLARTTGRSGRRLIIIDEAWHLINDPNTAPYLETLFRRARKWGTALSLITQDFSDMTQSRAAEICLRNAPLVLLLRQHPQSLNQLGQALHLTGAELERVSTASRGQGLLVAGDDRIPLSIWATPKEDEVIQRNGIEDWR